MYLHPATQRNLRALQDFGYRVIDPDHGEQACGEYGPGRSDPDDLISALDQPVLAPDAAAVIEQLNVMITAGPTREAIDPVRFISNHSSGVQGLSLAEVAAAAGANVTLVAGPGVPNCSASIHDMMW